MRKVLLWTTMCAVLIGHVSEIRGQKVPSPTYPTTLYLAGSGPDANGTMSDIRIVQHFTILEQPDGKGDYFSNDFKDEDFYRLDMKLKGGLSVMVGGRADRKDAQWTISSHFGWADTTILSGVVSGFKYGGPAGISTGQLRVGSTIYDAEGPCGTWEPGVYQGFTLNKEPSGRLYAGTYQFIWYHRLNAGLLAPIPSEKRER